MQLLRCIAQAVVNNGLKVLARAVPIGGALYEIAEDAWKRYCECSKAEAASTPEAALSAEVQALTQAPAATIHAAVSAAVQNAAADKPPKVQLALMSYLQQVPAMVRRSLRRPSDPSGSTVAKYPIPRRPVDLLAFLPSKLPRFNAGDRPLPGVDWILEELLGVGGFGEVWKARNPSFKSLVAALKFCLDERAAKSLRREAANLDRIMRHGRYEGIVPLRQVYLDGDPVCLEYEYVEGGDLGGLIRELHQCGPVAIDTAARWMLHLAGTVRFAHQMKPPMVHLDLKPANVLVQRGENHVCTLRVADFGISEVAARQATTEATRAPRSLWGDSATMVGAYTPLYASPQQMRGEPADPRDDIHALGVIWYQTLTGDLARGRPSGRGWRKPLAERGMEEEQLDLLEACIDDDPGERPADAGVLVQRLETLLAMSTRWKPSETGVQKGSAPDQPANGADHLTEKAEDIPRKVSQAHEQARRLAGTAHDYAAAAHLLETVPVHLRDNPLLDSLRDRRDRVTRLDAEVRQAVRESRLDGLRPKVVVLLELQPQRTDLGHLLERLPKDPYLGDIITLPLGQVKKGGFLGIGGKLVEVSMRFARVPPGQFLMGSPRDEKGRSEDESQHRVTWTKGFNLGLYPVTQAQWQVVMGGTPSQFRGDDRPVERVSWDDCQAFCVRLGQLTGKRFRMPTEAEWEFACRAGTTTSFFFGKSISTEQANFARGSSCKGARGPQTSPVSSFPGNAFGLFDMHGNIWEWCSDWYGSYPQANIEDPQGPDRGHSRVIRGGSWSNIWKACRSAARARSVPHHRYGTFGCRVCFCLD